MADKTARQLEMMHAPGERVRAVLLGELLHDDSLEVPLVVGEAVHGVLRAHLALADAQQSPSESANGVRGNADDLGRLGPAAPHGQYTEGAGHAFRERAGRRLGYCAEHPRRPEAGAEK